MPAHKKPLAQPGDPLELHDGTKIDPKTGRVIRESKFVEVPSNTDAQRIVASTRRRLSDLPAPPAQLNAISAVCAYTMVGLSDDEIAIATGLSANQIERIRGLDAYSEVEKAIIQSVVESDTSGVRAFINAHQRKAAETMVDIMQNGEEKNAVVAAKDILDRGGNRPVDVIEHRVKMEDEMRIVYIQRDERASAPALNINPLTGDVEHAS